MILALILHGDNFSGNTSQYHIHTVHSIDIYANSSGLVSHHTTTTRHILCLWLYRCIAATVETIESTPHTFRPRQIL